jgi:hypothetical protein
MRECPDRQGGAIDIGSETEEKIDPLQVQGTTVAHRGASVRGVQLTFWVSSIRSAQPMPVGPPVHPMRYASTSSRCSDQVLVLSTQS